MIAASIPPYFNIPFANSADSSHKRAIPEASQIGIIDGAASLTDGFPPLTFLPLTAGGIPPYGQDFNGILNEVTHSIQWQQAGGIAKYNSAFSTAIGGYPNGAVLQNAAKTNLWVSTVDNNLSNPDAGGAGWTLLISTATYTAGSGISVSGGVITNSLPGISYSSGSGISISGNVITNSFPQATSQLNATGGYIRIPGSAGNVLIQSGQGITNGAGLVMLGYPVTFTNVWTVLAISDVSTSVTNLKVCAAVDGYVGLTNVMIGVTNLSGVPQASSPVRYIAIGV